MCTKRAKRYFSYLAIVSIVASLLVFNQVAFAASTPTLIKNINGAGSSTPGPGVELDGFYYFAAHNGDDGRELWKTDGTSGGTELVADINEGAGSSNPTSLTLYNDQIFFAANDGTNGIELWKSDGTGEGTQIVKDIWDGNDSSPDKFVVVNGFLFFVAQTGDEGVEVWRSNGTGIGTVLLKDIAPGADHAFPTQLTGVNDDLLFFVANDQTNGEELWVSNGTEGGTEIIDIYTGGGNSSSPAGLTSNGTKLVFTASDGTNGREPWISDGTGLGTEMLADIDEDAGEGVDPQKYVVFEGDVYFVINNGTVQELWKTDGTVMGTEMVKEIDPGFNGSINQIELVVVEDVFYFSAYNDEDNYAQLWKSDGTEVGTELVYTFIDADGGGYPRFFYSVNGKLLFAVFDSLHGGEMWESDGTEEGTERLEINEFPFVPGGLEEQCDEEDNCEEVEIFEEGSAAPTNFGRFGDMLLFSANDAQTVGENDELWGIEVLSNTAPILTDLTAEFDAEDRVVDIGVIVNDDEDNNVSLFYYYESGECDGLGEEPAATIIQVIGTNGELSIEDGNTVVGIPTDEGDNAILSTWDSEEDIGDSIGEYCVYVFGHDGGLQSEVASVGVEILAPEPEPEDEDEDDNNGGGGGGGGGSAYLFNRTSTTTTNSNSENNSSESTSTFEDTKGHWAEDYIETLHDWGVVDGKAEGMFDPDASVTRAELLKMSLNGFDVEVVASTSTSFSDVELTDWFAGFVETGVEKGFVQGYTDGTFRPNQTVTRAEALVIIFQTARFNLDLASSHVFSDTPVTAWYAKFISFAVEKGIVSGYENGNFGPNDPLTRAQAAKIIVLALEL